MNSEIYIKGIVTVHFDMAIERTKFVKVCENLGLDSNNTDDFSESDWVSLRDQLSDEVNARPQEIEIIHACEKTVMIDQIDFLDDEHLEVTFNTHGTAVEHIEKDGESLTVKL